MKEKLSDQFLCGVDDLFFFGFFCQWLLFFFCYANDYLN